VAIQEKKDVVIVGYGAAGGPASVELARAGYSVVALEKGPHLTTKRDFAQNQLDTLRWVVRDGMIPGFDKLPFTFREDENEEAEPSDYLMASLVGGASVHWSGQSWRFFEDDFRVRSTVEELYGQERLRYLEEDGAAIEDWPISYDEVEPYYERVETHVGIGGWPGNIQGQIRPVNPQEGNPFEAPRQNDYPFRPLRDNATNLTYRYGALELGLHPFHVPTAILTRPYLSPYGVSRPPCTYCTFCTGHGCWNGSKSDTLVSLLPAAEATGNFELRPNCQVIRVNRDNGRAVSVDYVDTRTGEEHSQPGDIFILSAYSYQNVRLLLHSGVNGNGQVGRYFMTRSSPSVHATFDDRYLNGYNGPAVQRQGLDNYNGEVAFEEKLGLPEDEFFVRGAFMGSPSQRNPLESYDIVPPGVPTWGAAYKTYLKTYLNRFISLQLLTEPLPYQSGYIDLDPTYRDAYGVPGARVTRRIGENERRMGRFIHQKGVEILRAAGASRIWGDPEVQAIPSMTHDTGGCRMGEDPERSVTNRYCQMWELPNVFIGGGAVFPTMAGKNPTQTIWMLSYWLADAIIQGRADLGDAQEMS
jgi:gluconate 2-dehydrogenase alpha chain